MLIVEALNFFITHIPPEFVTDANAIEDKIVHESELNASVDDMKKYINETIHKELVGMIIGAMNFQKSKWF